MTWMENIQSRTGLTMETAMMLTYERITWRREAEDAAKSQNEND